MGKKIQKDLEIKRVVIKNVRNQDVPWESFTFVTDWGFFKLKIFITQHSLD